MKKTMILFAAMMTAGFLASAQNAATPSTAKAATEVKTQTVCPVMGGKIDKKSFVDVKGKRIYMCCPGCADKLKADPDKYIKQLEDQGITLDKTPEVKKEAAEAKKQ